MPHDAVPADLVSSNAGMVPIGAGIIPAAKSKLVGGRVGAIIVV
jgi:hypothetical protein